MQAIDCRFAAASVSPSLDRLAWPHRVTIHDQLRSLHSHEQQPAPRSTNRIRVASASAFHSRRCRVFDLSRVSHSQRHIDRLANRSSKVCINRCNRHLSVVAMSRTLAIQRIGSQLSRHTQQHISVAATAPRRCNAALLSASSAVLPFASHSAQPLMQQRRQFGHGPATAANDPNPMYVPLTGRQLEASELGNFPDQPACAPFGTLQYPALIYSGLQSRIVGCLGGGKLRHRLMWFVVKEGQSHGNTRRKCNTRHASINRSLTMAPVQVSIHVHMLRCCAFSRMRAIC